jgi:hypothetical protein
MWGTKLYLDTYECVIQWLEKVPCEGEVVGSNPAGRIAVNFAQKIPRLVTLAGGGLPRLKKIPNFFGFFSVRTLPSVEHSAKTALPTIFLPSSLCRALGKAPDSGSMCPE